MCLWFSLVPHGLFQVIFLDLSKNTLFLGNKFLWGKKMFPPKLEQTVVLPNHPLNTGLKPKRGWAGQMLADSLTHFADVRVGSLSGDPGHTPPLLSVSKHTLPGHGQSSCPSQGKQAQRGVCGRPRFQAGLWLLRQAACFFSCTSRWLNKFSGVVALEELLLGLPAEISLSNLMRSTLQPRPCLIHYSNCRYKMCRLIAVPVSTSVFMWPNRCFIRALMPSLYPSNRC